MDHAKVEMTADRRASLRAAQTAWRMGIYSVALSVE
jgi:hypothetical protein